MAIYAEKYSSVQIYLKGIKYERFGAWHCNEIYFPIQFLFFIVVVVERRRHHLRYFPTYNNGRCVC